MPEGTLIKHTRRPLTTASLTAELEKCGVERGHTVLVHTSMSKLGWVIGAQEAVIIALLNVVGPDGTIMMPTHTGGNSDPANWQNPPVPESWWQAIRDHMPGFNPHTAPTRQMGRVSELFRNWPGVIRSKHPTLSFAAHGPHAAYLIDDHVLEQGMGERSPIGRLYDVDGYVLLLGVGHGNNTSLHLAEYRADFTGKETVTSGCAIMNDQGQREWVTFEELDWDDGDFVTIGAEYEHKLDDFSVSTIGQADVRYLRQRPMVDFAVEWMEKNRGR